MAASLFLLHDDCHQVFAAGAPWIRISHFLFYKQQGRFEFLKEYQRFINIIEDLFSCRQILSRLFPKVYFYRRKIRLKNDKRTYATLSETYYIPFQITISPIWKFSSLAVDHNRNIYANLKLRLNSFTVD
jgi:hypothetical protein